MYKLPNLINVIDLPPPARCSILHLIRLFYRSVVLFCISALQAIFTAFRSQCGRIAAALHCTIRLDTGRKLHYNIHESLGKEKPLMRILIFGAGVLGCNLARNLFRAGKDVTLLARGNWAKEIQANGLRIKNLLSPHTSICRIPVITELSSQF